MPFRQSTVSIWTHLKPKFLEYSDLLEKTSSVFANELLAETFTRIEANQPGLPSLLIESLRRKIGKDADVRMTEKLHRQLSGIDPVAEEAKIQAVNNTSVVVPRLLRARRRGWSWAKASRLICGCLETELTWQLGRLYEDPLTLEAANIKTGGSMPSPALVRLYNEAYQILLRHILALAVGREIPPRFRSLADEAV